MTAIHRALRLRAEVPADVPETAMVMAAGLGTRMRPLTECTPKPLIKVAGKPLIDHVLERLASAGVKQVVANVHYLPDQIEAHLREATRMASTSPFRMSATCCSKPAADWSRPRR